MFASYPFLYDPEESVAIIDGTDEGMYGWITINYLLDKIGNKPQVPDASSRRVCSEYETAT